MPHQSLPGDDDEGSSTEDEEDELDYVSPRPSVSTSTTKTVPPGKPSNLSDPLKTPSKGKEKAITSDEADADVTPPLSDSDSPPSKATAKKASVVNKTVAKRKASSSESDTDSSDKSSIVKKKAPIATPVRGGWTGPRRAVVKKKKF